MTTSTHIPKRYRVTFVTLPQSLCPSVVRSPSLRDSVSVSPWSVLRLSVVRLSVSPCSVVSAPSLRFLALFHPTAHATPFERPRYGLRTPSCLPLARFSPLFHSTSFFFHPSPQSNKCNKVTQKFSYNTFFNLKIWLYHFFLLTLHPEMLSNN